MQIFQRNLVFWGLLALAFVAIWAAQAKPADAAVYSYAYVGAEDPDCASEALGGLGVCQVTGRFDLEQASFGTPQFALNADFQVTLNGEVFDTFSFFPFAYDDIFYCVEYCNEVITDATGSVQSLALEIFPPAGIDEAIFISEAGWSWDYFESGNGLFSGARGAELVELGPKPIPLAGAAWFSVGALGSLGLMRRRRIGLRSGVLAGSWKNRAAYSS